MKRIAITAAIVVALLAAAWYFTRPDPIAVALVTVERGPVAATVANTRAGTVDACRRAGLAPAMGGQIASLPVADGDHVEAGQLLLELWNEDLKAELTLAERDARAARSRAREACVVADVARRDAERLAALRADRLASEEAADQARGRAESTAAACAAAEDAVRVAEARVDVVKAQLERTQLRAPFAGVIAEINGELGEFVTPSPVGIPTPPTVDLIETGCVYVSAPIDEVDAAGVRIDMPARITLDAYPGRTFPGRVRRIAPYVLDVEKQARTVDVEVVFSEPADTETLLIGYSADIEVVLHAREDGLRVPTEALLEGKRVLVFDPEDEVLVEREVETGIANWQFTEVTHGVDAGERVVLSVAREGVRDGASAVVDDGTGSAAAGR